MAATVATAAAVASCAVALLLLQSWHGPWRGALEAAALLALTTATYAVYYAAWFAHEIRGSEALSVWWNRGMLTKAKARCRAMHGGIDFDFADEHYAEYLLQDEKEEDINFYDRILARRLAFLCWPSTCFGAEIAEEFRALGIGAADVLLDVGAGLVRSHAPPLPERRAGAYVCMGHIRLFLPRF